MVSGVEEKLNHSVDAIYARSGDRSHKVFWSCGPTSHIQGVIRGAVPRGDPIKDDQGSETAPRRHGDARIKLTAALEKGAGPVHEFNLTLTAQDLVFEKIGAQRRGKRITAKAIVVYLHQHIG